MLFRLYSEKLTEKTLGNRTLVFSGKNLVSFMNFVQILHSHKLLDNISYTAVMVMAGNDTF